MNGTEKNGGYEAPGATSAGARESGNSHRLLSEEVEKVNILLVDDLPEKMLALEAILTSPSFNLVKASSGRDALRHLLHDDFAVILLDVNMPGMDGFETATLIRKRKKSEHVPIIFVTAYGADDDRLTRGYSIGAVDYIYAPVVPEVLKAKVNVFAELFRINRKVRQQAWALQSYTVSLELANRELAQRTLELQSSRESFRNIVEKNAEGIAVLDSEGIIRFSNPAFGAMLGVPKRNVPGMAFPFPIMPGSIVETEFPVPEGESIPIEITMTETQWEGKKAYLANLRNVAERKRFDEALRQSEEKLRQAQKLESIGRLAGGVAHDFNNLLTAINGYSDLALSTLEDNHPVRSNLEEIRRSGERAAVLTHQLLAYSRKQVLMPKPLNVNNVVEGMANMLRRLIGENIELSTALAVDLGMVMVDTGQLEQAVMNLVVNARDAMPDGGKIVLGTCVEELSGSEISQSQDPELVFAPGRYAVVSVSDTGTGMDDATKARIFEPFFTTKEVGRGTGLGLSMVYGFVKQSGGNIAVTSEQGKGSVFRLYLPLDEKAGVPGTKSETLEKPAIPRGEETILLVEDENSVRKFLAGVLHKNGYRVVEAEDGKQAMAMAEAGEVFHLLVTDVMMANMGGKELATKLLGLRPELQVLFMSGYAEEAVLQHGELVSGSDFLQKPFSPDALAGKVREMLDMPRMRLR
jgi:signal transduction histidine kinase